MAYPQTANGMRDFLTYLQDKGLLTLGSAGGIRTACDKVFSALDTDERNNLATLDPEQAVHRFMNKNPGVLSPESASVYLSRVQKALRLLKEYNANPTSFRVSAPKKSNGTMQIEKKNPADKDKKTTSNIASPISSESHRAQDTNPVAVSSSISLTFPLRVDFLAQFILPKDMTTKEARKLAAYFEVLAIDFEPS
jgi:hypothetical protein